MTSVSLVNITACSNWTVTYYQNYISSSGMWRSVVWYKFTLDAYPFDRNVWVEPLGTLFHALHPAQTIHHATLTLYSSQGVVVGHPFPPETYFLLAFLPRRCGLPITATSWLVRKTIPLFLSPHQKRDFSARLILRHEDGGRWFLRNGGKFPQEFMVSHVGRQWSR
jgi:hypothetical protein